MFGWLFFWRKKPEVVVPPMFAKRPEPSHYSSPPVKRTRPYPKFPIRREVPPEAIRPTRDDDSFTPFVTGLALGSMLSSSDRGSSSLDDSFSGGGGNYSGGGASGGWDSGSSDSSSSSSSFDSGSSGGGDSGSSSSSID